MSTDTFTKVEVAIPNKSNQISIRPFVNGDDPMGLHRYNLVLFDGAIHEEYLACLDQNGVRRYVTGLNEFAPEVQKLGPEEKAAAIKDIRTTVAHLERVLVTNVLDVEDPNFWDKVKLLRPDNDAFWSKISVRCGNEPVWLDAEKDPFDLVKYRAIKAGGFDIVARDYGHAKECASIGRPKKFFLDRFDETVSVKVEVTKLRNKALSELQKLYEKNQEKMFILIKVLDPNSLGYRRKTSPDVIYEQLDLYINGNGVDKDKRKTAERFTKAASSSMESLTIRAVIKDSSALKLIVSKSDGQIYHEKTQTPMGRTPQDVAVFLANPLHQDIFTTLTAAVEQYWNK